MLELLVAGLLLIVLLLILGGGIAAGVILLRMRQSPVATRPPTTKRMELSGGHWALVRPHLTQAMWDALANAQSSSFQQNEDGRLIDDSGEDVTDAVMDQKARSLMLAGVSEWSYGAVDIDVLMNDVPLEDQETLSLYFVDEVVANNRLWGRRNSGT